MKGIAFLMVGLAATVMADEQFVGNPLRVQGQAVSRRNETIFTITLKNITDTPITELKITSAGHGVHRRYFRPALSLTSIPGKGARTITVSVRGTYSGLIDPCLIGIEGTLRQGKSCTTIRVPQPRSGIH